jgi:hypothetical protein
VRQVSIQSTQDVIAAAKNWLDGFQADRPMADGWVQGFEVENIIRGLLFHLNGSLGLIELMSTQPLATSPTPAEQSMSSSAE